MEAATIRETHETARNKWIYFVFISCEFVDRYLFFSRLVKIDGM